MQIHPLAGGTLLQNARLALENSFPQIKEKRIVLYAPTFRGTRIAYAHMPEGLDYNKLLQALDDDTILLIKAHPFIDVSSGLADGADDRIIDASRFSIDALLAAADVLVTDYSSVIFEYSLLGRPMVFFAPDLEEYEQERSFYYDYKDFVPGPIAQTTEDLIGLLQNTDTWFDASVVQAFCERFMSACDGHATERILEATGL